MIHTKGGLLNPDLEKVKKNAYVLMIWFGESWEEQNSPKQETLCGKSGL